MTPPSILKRANQAFRLGNFDEAPRAYQQDAEAFPELAQFHAFLDSSTKCNTF